MAIVSDSESLENTTDCTILRIDKAVKAGTLVITEASTNSATASLNQQRIPVSLHKKIWLLPLEVLT